MYHLKQREIKDALLSRLLAYMSAQIGNISVPPEALIFSASQSHHILFINNVLYCSPKASFLGKELLQFIILKLGFFF